MAFVLTNNITIGADEVKANKVTWKTDVNSFTDTCTIDLPRIFYLQNEAVDSTKDFTQKSSKKKEYKFKAGDKVSVYLGIMAGTKSDLKAL